MNRVPYPLAKLGNRLVQLLAADGHENCRVSLQRRPFRAPRFLVVVDEQTPNHETITLSPAQAATLAAYLRESGRSRLLQEIRGEPAENGAA